VRLLLDHGIYMDAENIDGMTPFPIAVARGHDEIMRLLAKHGCQVRDIMEVTSHVTPQVIEG